MSVYMTCALQYTVIDYVTYLSGYMSGLASQNYVDQRQNFHFFLPLSGILSFQFCEDFFIIKIGGKNQDSEKCPIYRGFRFTGDLV